MENKSILSKPTTGGSTGAIATPDDGELHLTPKASSTGAEGTIFYDSGDDHIYVGTEGL
uniref:Uncharacterized protein n=1 Tax=viral metagenome TaxID=1070528 RepID=A0A6M3JFM4_9ZZZZ